MSLHLGDRPPARGGSAAGMTSRLGATLAAVEDDERRQAVRALLRQPLMTARGDPDGFAMVLRHRGWLRAWFAEQAGWTLAVDRAAGFARLLKVPPRRRGTRPAGAAGRPAFDRRRYTLLCLTLAALDDSPMQTTLVRLAELVQELSAEEDGLRTFDGTVHGERRALVDVLRWLVELGVLHPRDGDAEKYVRGRQGDALYDVNDRLLGQLLATPVPPTLAGDPARMMQEPYAATEEGTRRRARHQVFRTLLDEPVLYYEDLGAAEYGWLDHSRGFVYQQLEDHAGLVVERRREGLAPVDPEGRLTDERFPDGGSTVKHAALLLAEQLTARHREDAGRAWTDGELARVVAALMEDLGQRCGWSKQYLGAEGGAARLAADAMTLLEGFDLVRRAPVGWTPRPALARFAPRAPGDTAP
jgi:uncharacterized protein (TIGR02678 family)